MNRKLNFLPSAALLFAALVALPAHGDSLGFSLTQPEQVVSAQAGATLGFTATASAPSSNAGSVYLDGDAFNVSSPLTLDDSAFLLGFPILVEPGQSFMGLLFTLDVPTGTVPGNYFGSFTLLGRVDGSGLQTIAMLNYSVEVTPEPSAVLLFGTGVIALLVVLRTHGHSLFRAV